MLVLTRRPDQSIYLKDKETGVEILFTVVRVNGNNVRVGIEAPDRIQIVRTEIMEKKEEVKQ